MSFLLFINFLFLISPWPYLCVFIYIIVRINKQRDKLFEFSSFLSTVDLSKHLITARQFCDFQCTLFSAIDRVWLNLYERALSGNEQLPFIKTFVREFSQCRPLFVFYTESVMLGQRFLPESVFYTQSVMLSPRFIPSPCFIPSP